MLNATNSSTVDNFKLFVCQMTLSVHFVVALRYVMDFTTPLYLGLVTCSNSPRCVCFASNVTSVGDVTSVNTVLQQCTGKVVRLNIQFEITYSTTVVEFNTSMLLAVRMERCNFISAGIETSNGTFHL